jgi:hypothetical protein
MPTEREKRQRDKERLREQREALEKRAAMEARMLFVKTSFPSAEARVKEALKCPHQDYPEMDGADLQKKLQFFDVSQHMYYQFKRKMDAAFAIAAAQASLDAKIREQELIRDGLYDELLEGESAAFSRGESAELRARILDTLHVRVAFLF